MSREPRELSDEDRVLWTLVARSAEPLKKRRPAYLPSAALVPEPPSAVQPPFVAPSTAAAPPKKTTRVSPSLDRPTREKLSSGRLPIEGRVDLHGMTQDQAYFLLLSFLRRAQANNVRYVLVITGKGSSLKGDGVLRRSVPAWLDTPPFRALVASRDEAARQHGGGGALYLRLRRPA